MTERFVRTQIRIPNDLHRWLTEAIKRSGNSMNEEMVQRLTSTFQETLQQLQVKNRLLEIGAAERDILAEIMVVDTLVMSGAPKERIVDAKQQAQARIDVLEKRKEAIRADINNLIGADDPPIDVSKIKKPRKRR